MRKNIEFEFVLVICMFLMTLGVKGQVVIGGGLTSERAAILNLKDQEETKDNITSSTGGLLLPRVALLDLTTLEPLVSRTDAEWIDVVKKEKLVTEHIGLEVYNTTNNGDLRKGAYVWNGEVWEPLFKKIEERVPNRIVFPLPAFNLPLINKNNIENSRMNVDLYQVYVDNIKANNFITNIPDKGKFILANLYSAEEIDYVVTHYDKQIITIHSISNRGIMDYTVHNVNPGPESFLNIYLVVHEGKEKNKNIIKMQIIKEIKLALILLIGMGLSINATAQVTIGSEGMPNRAAILDIKDRDKPGLNNETSTTGGVLLPRVLLVDKTTLEPFISRTDSEWTNSAANKIKEKHVGLQVYNLSTTNEFSKGMYIWNGIEWEKQDVPEGTFEQNVNYFFYLPSFNIDIEANTRKVVDLYAEYERQFTRKLNNNFVSNSNYTLDVLPMAGTDRLYRRDELDYVITDFDGKIINPNTISMSNDGKLTMDIISTATSKKSYFNILFIIKR